MKKLFPVLLAFFVLFLAGCGKQVDTTVLSTGSVQGFTTSYTVGASPVFQKALYGTVIADSIKTITSNRGGILEYINCQPGKEVTKDTIIAKIQPNADDVTYQNSSIQLSVLQQQLDNFTTIYSMTEDTLALQKDILQDQYTTNKTLLSNLEKSQGYTESSLDYQQDLLDQQYDTLKESKSTDMDKMTTSIANAHQQYLIMIKDALKKVNDVFANTNYSVSDKDTSLRQEVLSQYTALYDKVSDTMNASEFSTYLSDISDFMSLAAKGITATTPSTALPQSNAYGTSIDGLYTTYTTLATTFMTSKSAFDTLASSYDSVKNTYNSQIKTLATNTDNFTDNTIDSTVLQLENQKTNLQLTQKTLANQLQSSDDGHVIQLATLKNQLLTLQQNISLLSNSLEGEVLYAGVNGIVKMRAIGEDNKVAPNTLLCQISPKDPGNLSLQIFSYQEIPLGTKVAIANEAGNFLGTGTLMYEYPYKDPTTQNYIYEIPVITLPLIENERVLVMSSQLANSSQIRIPLQYVSPRLEGNLVRRKVGNSVQSIYVTLGNIDGEYVQVVSGLNLGDEIVQ